MYSRRLKRGYLVLEGLHSFSSVYYFYYFYFYMQKVHGFGNKENLMLAAMNGITYGLGALWAGKFAQRNGYFTALKLGFAIMVAALGVGSQLHSALGHAIVMLVSVFGLCFTWPVLEALVSEGEPRAGLQHMVGIYNVVWAITGAVSYFVGGALLDKLGMQTLFYIPMGMLVGQLALTFWLQSRATQAGLGGLHHGAQTEGEEIHPHAPEHTRMFLRMAWLANPFAYIAINTVVAVIPGVAHRLELSTMMAGFCCSAWCFARLGSFCVLWLWDGWHYRFRWLLASFIGLVCSFAAILMIPNLYALVIAQVIFGCSIGLMYYSSLFYSMDLSDTKGEHGGIHEAAIGFGNFAGPTVGAVSLQFLPQYANSGAIAVSCVLFCGLCGMLAIWGAGVRRAVPVENG